MKKVKLDDGRMANVPGIDPNLNLYDHMVEMAKTDQSVRLVVQALDETMDHFEIPAKDRSEFGNMIERFAMFLSIQDDPNSFTIPADDVELNFVADLYEEFNRRSEILVKSGLKKEAEDGQHRHGV